MAFRKIKPKLFRLVVWEDYIIPNYYSKYEQINFNFSMSIFNIFEKKEKTTSSNTISAESPLYKTNDLCSENAVKKHFLMYILLSQSSCFYMCKDLKEQGKVYFLFKDNELYTGNDDIIPAYIFSWISRMVIKDQNDFTRLFEILNRGHVELYSSSMLMSPCELVEKIKYYFPNFSLGNDPTRVKTSLEWTYIDICIMHAFFLETSEYVHKHLYDENTPDVKEISNCNTVKDLQNIVLYNIKNAVATK
jgi:hypothetical protein